MPVKRKPVNSYVVKTIEEVGRFLQISARQVSSYLARDCPGKPGCYPLDEIVAWVRENVWTKRQTPLRPLAASLAFETATHISRSGRTRSMRRLADLAGVDVADVEAWRRDETFPIAPDGSVSEWAFCLWTFETGRVPE